MRTHDVETFSDADHPKSTEQRAQIIAHFVTKYFPTQLALLLDSKWPRYELWAPNLDVIGWKTWIFPPVKITEIFELFAVFPAADFSLAIKI